jgi:hypothetical protein
VGRQRVRVGMWAGGPACESARNRVADSLESNYSRLHVDRPLVRGQSERRERSRLAKALNLVNDVGTAVVAGSDLACGRRGATEVCCEDTVLPNGLFRIHARAHTHAHSHTDCAEPCGGVGKGPA